MSQIPFNNTYVNLGEAFYVRTAPTPVAGPELIKFNHDLAEKIDIAAIGANQQDCAAIFSGNSVPAGAEPVAMAYSGHQFGHFNAQLGDGRAILLGEVLSTDGVRFDVQLKGSGPTAFSRDGDGRAALGPVLREYLVSEAMVKLGVPTTRALAAVTTGEQVARERLLPGGIITRVATSFVRVGTFQYFAARDDLASITKLADYVINRNYPQALDQHNCYEAFLMAVVERQAALIAQWMQIGFIHGVMNTDNMSIAGETIDYGPCAFMDGYAHDRVFSSIDRRGRYAYSNQASIGLWNLTRLAETLLPLLAKDTETAIEIAQGVLKSYVSNFENEWLKGMRAKCGLTSVANAVDNDDRVLIEKFLETMATYEVDFTLAFHYLSQCAAQASVDDDAIKTLFGKSVQFDTWLEKWRNRLALEDRSDAERQIAMQMLNPVYIPRNHQIEAAIRAAEDRNDFTVFHDLYDVVQNPYQKQQGKERYMLPPEPDEIVRQTFCGT